MSVPMGNNNPPHVLTIELRLWAWDTEEAWKEARDIIQRATGNQHATLNSVTLRHRPEAMDEVWGRGQYARDEIVQVPE